MTQPTSAESHTSPITLAMATSSSVRSGLSGCMARVSIEVISMPTWWISLCTDASANMKARVRASVRCGLPCSPRVVRVRMYITRSCGVSPGTGLLRPAASAFSNSRPSAETSRWILEGK